MALEAQRADITTSAQPSYVRILHAVPDAPNVDVYVNGNRVLRDVAFKDVSDYLTLPAGKYHIDIYPAGTSVTTVISKKVKIDPGKVYTLAATGTVKKLQLLPFIDDPTVPSGETKVKFIHLSPDAPAVDIAVKGGDVIFPRVSFKEASDYLGLTPMTVNLEARVAGSKNSVLSVPNVKLSPNQAYTIVAVGLANGSPELEAILLMG
ncbi:DUF4397 domain-containing protein [Rossellomorea sp. AcN35-11]|nr:DUF4397 domain-containing protein [Rossellomorea sp. AcN35-11]